MDRLPRFPSPLKRNRRSLLPWCSFFLKAWSGVGPVCALRLSWAPEVVLRVPVCKKAKCPVGAFLLCRVCRVRRGSGAGAAPPLRLLSLRACRPGPRLRRASLPPVCAPGRPRPLRLGALGVCERTRLILVAERKREALAFALDLPSSSLLSMPPVPGEPFRLSG